MELLVETIPDDVAAAMKTVIGQRSVERLIDVSGWRWFPMGVPAVLLAGDAARLPGFRLGFALRERGGLSLGGTPEVVDAAEEFADGLFEPRVAFTQLLILDEELLVRRRAHVNLDSDAPCRPSESVVKLRVTGQGALNKHAKSAVEG